MPHRPIDITRAKQLFDYDPKTGALIHRRRVERIWKDKAFNTRCAGKRATYLVTEVSGRKTLSCLIDKKSYPAARIIWAIYHGVDPGSSLLDHKNGNALDNKITNLRLSNFVGNARNRKTSRRNKSGYLGVYRHTRGGKFVGGWYFKVMGDNKVLEEGSGFLTPRKAAIARDIVAKRLHGEFFKSSIKEHDDPHRSFTRSS